MDEREELARLLAIFFASNRQPHMSGDPSNRLSPLQRRDLDDAVSEVIAAGWRKMPEPGSAEWEAMVERAALELWECGASRYWLAPKWEDEDASIRKSFRENAEAALRAALGLDQPHRENDERPEEQP